MIEIKKIEHDNIEQLVKLRIAYFKDVYDNFSYEEEQILINNMTSYLAEHLNNDCFSFIAFENDIAVSCGSVNLLTKIPNKNFIQGQYAEIYNVYTLPEYRRKGYSKQIILAINDLLVDKSIPYVKLSSSSEGLQLYKGCGFISDTTYTSMYLKTQ